MNHMWYGIGILVFLVLAYIFAYRFNAKVERPEGVEIPESCMHCTSTSCSVKTVEDIKAEMIAEIRKQEKCDEIS
ncbi:MAG TPA: hypothetical protein GXZ35_00535 [Acholeplasmataceae bacterium]|nr:hypothetical protein [Acholeplasmataceae bacterium]